MIILEAERQQVGASNCSAERRKRRHASSKSGSAVQRGERRGSRLQMREWNCCAQRQMKGKLVSTRSDSAQRLGRGNRLQKEAEKTVKTVERREGTEGFGGREFIPFILN